MLQKHTQTRDSSSLSNLSSLESALGHQFASPELLLQALTHRSLVYELAIENTGRPDASARGDNERLEFLGDAVLGLVVAESLYASQPTWQEGELTRLRAQLVSRRNMADVAQNLGLGQHLRLGKGEERSGGRRKPVLLANAMEAVIAALFLDGGAADGIALVRLFARRHILGVAADALASQLSSGAALGDHKSALQQHLQANRAGIPVYIVEGESGPDHRKRFVVDLRLRQPDGEVSEPLASGTGTTKKKAEQEAASRALELLRALPPEPVAHATDSEVEAGKGRNA
jgi:ribonuclease-3